MNDAASAAGARLLIRQYQPADRDDIAEVCLRTAASGGDATGVYSDDRLMPEVFALPYLDYDPSLAFVVTNGHRVVGYVLGVADTRDFVDWWRREWAPGFAARHPHPGPPTASRPAFDETQLIEAGTRPERMLVAELDDYPAHLHIDLLPEAQGQGLGRRLIDVLRAALRGRGVPGVHLGIDPENTGARAFYERLGFVELPSSTEAAPLFGIATA
ncbi:GNAT family N-acetyltransferase [Agromyces soli]